MTDKYIIVNATDFDLLMEYVNQKLAKGYVCQGGVCVDNESYMQAMIKYGRE